MNTATAKSASTVFPRPTRGTQRLLKYPILIIVLLVVLIELLIYFILRLGVIIYEYFMSLCQCRSNSKLWNNLRNVSNYKQYVEYAKELDTINRRDDWKHKKDSYCYDSQLVQQNLDQLKKYQNNKDYTKLSEQTIEIFNHILKWFEEESLYTQCNYGTKYIVEEFIYEVEHSMKLILNCDTFSCSDKLKIFIRLQQEFGRTCLCLSGGATMTFYQFGVIKCLFDNGLLPNIISGTSGGSLVGCTIACRTDKELETFLNPKLYKYLNAANEPLIIRIERLLRTGFMFDWDDWRDKLRQLTKGDMTFYEAYQLTGRIFNVTAISTNHTAVLLNYKTTPDVCIWSAVIASSSLPGCMKPSPLIAKKYDNENHNNNNYELVQFNSYGKLWCDGSIKYDVPKQRLLEDFNVKYTICVQCNLHVFIFYYNGRGTANSPISHWGRSGMRGGFLSSFLEKILKLELRKWMTVLSDFDLIPQIWSIDLRFTAIQQNRGTITINPKPNIIDCMKMVSDPDYYQLKKCFNKGNKLTYPYLYMIQNRIKLQNLIRDSIKQLDKNNGGKHNILNELLTMGYGSIDLQLPDMLRNRNRNISVCDNKSNKQTENYMLRRGSI
eukprot:431371_1